MEDIFRVVIVGLHVRWVMDLALGVPELLVLLIVLQQNPLVEVGELVRAGDGSC